MNMLAISILLGTLFVSQAAYADNPAKITEYDIPTSNSVPKGISLDNRGMVWFTENNASQIGMFNPETGAFTEYQVNFPPWCVSYNILDKLIYFTGGDYNNGSYGVLNPATGAISEFPTGIPVASSVECTITSSGNFWFNGWDSQTVSKADKFGSIVNYIPSSFGYTSGLTEDPTGNLWLTIVGGAEYNPALLKLDTSLAQPDTSSGFTTIPLPTNQETIRRPLAALGKIWFPMMNSSKIASYDPTTGLFESFPTPTPNAVPDGLAVDRWGRIWFSEVQANKIGVLDLRTRTISEFPVPTANSSPGTIAVDNNQNVVWFIESSGNKIGKLQYTTVAVPTSKDQCKNGGWQWLTRADGSVFKNQGDCIQYVNTGKEP